MNFKKLIEALLYIRGDAGLSSAELKLASDISIPEARAILKKFLREYNKEEHGIMVLEFNDVFKFATREEFLDKVKLLALDKQHVKLSNAALETVGIIAYKQPATKSQVNVIRGVSSEAVVNTLLLKGLIQETGVANTPGNPVLYGVTTKFYDYFRIKSLSQLPSLEQFQNYEGTEDDFDLFESQRED